MIRVLIRGALIPFLFIYVFCYSVFTFADEQGAIDILSWNVWFDEVSADNRFPQVLDNIGELNPDIALLQEVTPTFIEHYYQSALSEKYFLMASKQAKRNYGQAYLSRRRLFTTHNEPLFSAYGRSVFFGLLQINDHQAVLLVNVHLESGRFESSVRAQQIEAINNQHLPAFLNKLRSEVESPEIVGIVWGGDFNLNRKEGHPLLSQYWHDTATHFKNTLPTYDLTNNELAKEHAGLFEGSYRLDRFYIQPGRQAKAQSYQLHNAPLFGTLSDHYPISLTLAIDRAE